MSRGSQGVPMPRNQQNSAKIKAINKHNILRAASPPSSQTIVLFGAVVFVFELFWFCDQKPTNTRTTNTTTKKQSIGNYQPPPRVLKRLCFYSVSNDFQTNNEQSQTHKHKHNPSGNYQPPPHSPQTICLWLVVCCCWFLGQILKTKSKNTNTQNTFLGTTSPPPNSPQNLVLCVFLGFGARNQTNL